jgi:transposase
MGAKFVCVDRDTPLLMPPDLREWVPKDHLLHFIMEAVGLLDLSKAEVNERGTGSRQYPPSLMLGLLIYSYATGTFSSRQIERATYENVAVRLLCADLHPDHDSVCTFRRANHALLKSSFEQVLAMAVQMRVLKVGQVTLAVDGTKIQANASKHSAVSHGRALAQIELLEKQVAERTKNTGGHVSGAVKAQEFGGFCPSTTLRGCKPPNARNVARENTPD